MKWAEEVELPLVFSCANQIKIPALRSMYPLTNFSRPLLQVGINFGSRHCTYTARETYPKLRNDEITESVM